VTAVGTVVDEGSGGEVVVEVPQAAVVARRRMMVTTFPTFTRPERPASPGRTPGGRSEVVGAGDTTGYASRWASASPAAL
jgi:hypothetical protein